MRLLVGALLVVVAFVHFRLFCGLCGLRWPFLLLRWYLLVARGLVIAERG
jgi:hypothetical protein